MPANIHRPAHRPGVSLVELVVVIALQTVLLGAAVGLIGRLLEAEQTGRAQLESMTSLDALVRQFRSDVNAATASSIGQDAAAAARIELQLAPDRTATYEIDADRVMRLEKQGTDVVHRQAYRLGRDWTVTFEEVANDSHRMVRMAVFAPAGATRTPNVPRLICDSVLGLDSDKVVLPKGSTP